MKYNKRINDIIKILNEKGRVSVSELSKILFVSEMTIRRDFIEMEKESIIKRYRGGAVLISDGVDMSISKRFFVNEESKKALSKEAASFISDNMTVYIDSSSTCQHIVTHIRNFKNITITTNSIKTLLMASKLSIRCILIGGEYYEKDMCFVGTVAEQYAKQFNFDIAFFSSMGLSQDGIISDMDINQAAIRKIIMANSEKNIFLFDKDKLNKKYMYTLCRKDETDKIIILSEK